MPVKVASHPATGLVITPSVNKPLFGTVRVDSENVSLENGFMNKSKRSAFIRGSIVDLTSLGLTAGKVMPGKIVKKESYNPFFEGQSPKINPTTAEVVLTNGRETYLQYDYTADQNAPDLWIGETTLVVSEQVENALGRQFV